MKARVLVEFYDKVAKKERKAGDVIDVTARRFNEIARAGGYVEAYEAPVKAVVEEENEKE